MTERKYSKLLRNCNYIISLSKCKPFQSNENAYLQKRLPQVVKVPFVNQNNVKYLPKLVQVSYLDFYQEIKTYHLIDTLNMEPILFYNSKRDIFRYLKSIFHVRPKPTTQENLDNLSDKI